MWHTISINKNEFTIHNERIQLFKRLNLNYMQQISGGIVIAVVLVLNVNDILEK